MAGKAASIGKSRRRSVGRPRRLTLEKVVAAACEIEGDKLDMATVARRLKVGIATLYGYLQGRDHLLRLITERRNRMGRIVDRGQCWQDIAREHVVKSVEIWSRWPQLIQQVVDGEVAGVLSKEYLECLLALLTKRGFSAAMALSFYYEISQIVMGSAVAGNYMRSSFRISKGGHDEIMRSLVRSHPPDELPTLRLAVESATASSSIIGSYTEALNRLILDYEGRLKAVNSN
jgi:hypothetical protein